MPKQKPSTKRRRSNQKSLANRRIYSIDTKAMKKAIEMVLDGESIRQAYEHLRSIGYDISYDALRKRLHMDGYGPRNLASARQEIQEKTAEIVRTIPAAQRDRRFEVQGVMNELMDSLVEYKVQSQLEEYPDDPREMMDYFRFISEKNVYESQDHGYHNHVAMKTYQTIMKVIQDYDNHRIKLEDRNHKTDHNNITFQIEEI